MSPAGPGVTAASPGVTAASPGVTAAPAGVPPPPARRPSTYRVSPRLLATVAAVVAAVLAGTSTGSVVVVALLIGLATVDRWAGAAVLLAGLAASIRFGTGSLDDLAGIQSVLGPAGVVGPGLAAASAWAAAAAVVLATGPPDVPGGGNRPWRFAPALATGLLAATLVAGPGPSDLAVRVGASIGAVVVAAGVSVLDDRAGWRRARRGLSLALAVAAVVLSGWPA